MGGTGVAYRSPVTINYINPASLGAIVQKAFLFDVGVEGTNYYMKSTGLDGVARTSSFNSFNLSDIAVAFPLAKGIGFSVSMTPFSSVGYRIETQEEDPAIVANIGQVRYTHLGEGGINQFKAGMGVALSKNFSLGADLIYYKGRINRTYYITVLPVMAGDTYNSVNAVDFSNVSRFYGALGFQWNIIATDKRLLTFGGTFQPGGKLGMSTTRYIPSSDILQDTVAMQVTRTPFKMASTARAGLYYGSMRWSFAADYTFQNWGVNTQSEAPDLIQYVNTNSIRLGAELTPDRSDFRHALNRWSYRAGFRYDQYYMKVRDTRLADAAFTFGVGVPIKMGGFSMVNAGLEVGQKGVATNGLIRTYYFKILLGFSLFGDDFWFVQPKYD